MREINLGDIGPLGMLVVAGRVDPAVRDQELRVVLGPAGAARHLLAAGRLVAAIAFLITFA